MCELPWASTNEHLSVLGLPISKHQKTKGAPANREGPPAIQNRSLKKLRSGNQSIIKTGHTTSPTTK